MGERAHVAFESNNGATVVVSPANPLPVTGGGGGGGGDASAANQVTTNNNIGATNETAAAADTSTSGLNGLMKRLLQRVTALINALGGTDGLRSPTGTLTSVNSNTSAVTILAANASRKGAIIYNNETTTLNLLLSATGTVSATVFSVPVLPGTLYEVPFGYSGVINGIWLAAGSGAGNAKVTEVT